MQEHRTALELSNGSQTIRLLHLAWPIAISMLSYSLMTAVDTAFVGRLGADAIAAVGLGGVFSFTCLTFGLGLLRAAKVRVAHAVGAGQGDRVSREAGAALVLATMVAGITVLVTFGLAPLLAASSPGPSGIWASQYVWVRGIGIPFVLWAAAVRESSQGLGDSRSPMVAALVANVANIPLNAWLVLGLDWGVVGSACANAVAQLIECLWLVGQRRAWVLGVSRVERRAVVDLWRIGWVLGLEFLLDVSSFSALAFIMARVGPVQLAAHQVVVQISHLTMLPIIALAEGSGILAGQAVGAKAPALVPRLALSGTRLAWVLAGTAALAFLWARWHLARTFTTDLAVQLAVVRLLVVAAVLQLLWVPYTVTRATLRGAGDIRFSAVTAVVVAWVVTPPLAYVLGVQLHMGAVGGWTGLCAEVTLAAGVFIWRLSRERWQKGLSIREARVVS